MYFLVVITNENMCVLIRCFHVINATIHVRTESQQCKKQFENFILIDFCFYDLVQTRHSIFHRMCVCFFLLLLYFFDSLFNWHPFLCSLPLEKKTSSMISFFFSFFFFFFFFYSAYSCNHRRRNSKDLIDIYLQVYGKD